MTLDDTNDSESPEPETTTPDAQERERPPELPDEATVVSETTLVSPKGRRYRILRTTQQDAYDDHPENKGTDAELRDRDG